jgi:hypothetical protein
VPWLLTKSFWCFKIKDKVDSIKKSHQNLYIVS